MKEYKHMFAPSIYVISQSKHQKSPYFKSRQLVLGLRNIYIKCILHTQSSLLGAIGALWEECRAHSGACIRGALQRWGWFFDLNISGQRGLPPCMRTATRHGSHTFTPTPSFFRDEARIPFKAKVERVLLLALVRRHVNRDEPGI